jgi:FeoB-associated Cys-rich membrane protein
LDGKKMQISDSWQFIIVGGIVLLAVAYLIRRSVRSWRMTGRGCGGSCGCATKTSEVKEAPVFIPSDQITVRRGTSWEAEPPEVHSQAEAEPGNEG